MRAAASELLLLSCYCCRTPLLPLSLRYSLNILPPNPGFEISQNGTLFKRKDYINTDAAAKSQPHRTYYYRKDVDLVNVIELCSNLIKSKPLTTSVENATSDATDAAAASSSYLSASTLLSHSMDHATKTKVLFIRGTSFLRQSQYANAIKDLTDVINMGVRGGGRTNIPQVGPRANTQRSER